MDWLTELFSSGASPHGAIASAVLVLALVIASGLALGSLKVRGLSLGIAGVLFAGIAFGHFGLNINPDIRDFLREFGLVLFVYTIGMQVGPGFLSSLRKSGLKLNLLAASVVVLGVAAAVLIHYLAQLDSAAAVGLLSGATTNTPSLAAAQQALAGLSTSEARRVLPGLGYAVAYPFGVIGLIGVTLLLRRLFKVDLQAERQAYLKSAEEGKTALEVMNIEVQNPNLVGVALQDLPLLPGSGVVISRILQDGAVRIATPEMVLQLGTIILAVGPPDRLEQLRMLVGALSQTDLQVVPSSISTRRLIVSKRNAVGRTVDELNLLHRHGVVVSRVSRAEVELPVGPAVKLQFGDVILAVGEPGALDRAALEVGNSPKQLNHPLVVPIFVGIALGVILGSWPMTLPGVPAAVKLGLAGGPLLVAIVLSRVGRIGPLVWYMPMSANFMLREVGIALFLACVGLKAGDKFVATLTHGDGMQWLLLAALITVIPPLLVGIVARVAFKLNYLAICGLLAGSMTDPPALAFVTQSTGSEGPAIAYSTVYPLAMLLRVLTAQLVVLYLA